MANDTKNYENQIVAYLDRIVRAVRRLENATAVECGLNPLQLRVLQVLATAHRPVTVGLAADELEVTEPTMSDSVRALSLKGLVKKTTDPTDRRIKYLHLTASGKHVAARFGEITRLPLENLEPALLARLSADLHQLVAGLFGSRLLHHARICMTCAHFSPASQDQLATCGFLKKKLKTVDLQTDCPDHVYQYAAKIS